MEKHYYLKLPRLITVNDYHEFDRIEDFLRQLGIKRVKVKEIGFSSPMYVGIVYTRKDHAYNELLKKFEDSIKDDYESY